MAQIIDAREPVRLEVWDRDRAIRHYEATGEPFKVELVDAIPGRRPDPDVLARPLAGPLPRPAPRQHRPGAGRRLQADVDRRRLLARRLAPADAAAHLRRRLPHRRTTSRPTCTSWRRPPSATTASSGSEMELFHLQEEAPGTVFWHPNGCTIWRALEDYMRRRLAPTATSR